MNAGMFAIIPATVRYDKNLSPNSKLLYGEITALCSKEGFCWASNRYFADLYSVTNRSITKWVKELSDNGYIFVEIGINEEHTDTSDDNKKYVYDRKIYLTSNMVEQLFQGDRTNVLGGVEENFYNTNTSINTSIKDNMSSSDNLEPKDKNISMAEVDKIIEEWNKIAPIKSREIVRDSSRYKNLNTIYKRYGLDAITEMINKVGKSGFLQGTIKGYNGNYFNGCSFNWCIQDSKFNDILEGKFDDNKNRKDEKTDGEYQQFIYDDGSRNEEDNRPSPADVLRAAIEAAEAKERNE